MARIDTYATEHHLSRHLAILLMLDEGYRSLSAAASKPNIVMQRLPPEGAVWPSGAVVEPRHMEDPAPKFALGDAVTFGARRAAFGERAKKPKGGK